MEQTGEWGEFFPMWLSPFPYNITYASQYYPMTREEIEAKGMTYEAEQESNQKYDGAFFPLPLSADDTDKTIIDKALKCEKTGRPYQILQREFEYLKARDIPFPRVHPDVRAAARKERHPPLQLFEQPCTRCGQPARGSTKPGSGLTIYCKRCYEEVVLA
jgi:hypothetical protein